MATIPGIKDLAASLDKLAGEMKEADLVKALRADDATASLQPLKKALDEVYGIQGKILDQFDRAIKVNRVRLNQLTKERDHAKWEKEANDKKIKALKTLGQLNQQQNDQLDELLKKQKDQVDRIDQLNKKRKVYMDTSATLKKQQVDELENSTTSNAVANKWAGTIAKTSKFLGQAAVAVDLYKIGLGYLRQAVERVYNWQNTLQKSLSGLADRFGAATASIIDMRNEGLKQLLDPGGLGGLGLELDDIVGRLADFRDAFGFVGKVSQSSAADMIKLGMAVGLTADQTGELARVFTVAGQGIGDTRNFMKSLAVEAARAGVTSARLAKQFTGAAKELFMLSGPKARMQLVKTAGALEKMGTGLDKISGFVNLTDSFDQTAEAMAKVNTVFGTHINALEVMAEMDPEKRFKMVQQQLKIQGVNLENLTRIQKKFLAQSLGLQAEDIDAMLAHSKLSDQQVAAEKEMNDLEAKRLESQKAIEMSMISSKKVLIAFNVITAHINDTMSKGLAPLFESFGEATGMKKFEDIVTRITGIIDTIYAKMGSQGVGNVMESLGKSFGNIFNAIEDFLTSTEFATFATGLVSLFDAATDVISFAVTALSPILKFFARLIGEVSQVLSLGIKAAKFIGIGMANAAGAGMDDTTAQKEMMQSSATFQAMDSGDYSNVTKPAASKALVTAGAAGGGASIGGPPPVIEARAAGGPIQQGQFYMVGESGPELIMAPSDGMVMPAASSGGGGGGGGGGMMAPINVQVILDGEVIQERMFKGNLRRIQ